mmetsp:Transcript_27830/g.26656  ORF Transcript_27830/g.26656 Transcript_27830/m.26656 type:complete len:967 (-) Transcript_27830:71-2971(-)
MIRSPIFSVAYTLVYLLTFGLGFYPKSGRNTRQQIWKNRDSKFDQKLSMRTLLIDNFDSYTYNIWQLLSEVNGEEPIVVYNNAFNYDWEELLRSVQPFDNIVLSPGPGSPDIHADFGLCKDAILQSNLPVLGVCLGHQGIAHHFGGVVKRAKTPMHGRLSTIKHTNEGLFYDIPQDSKVVRYHSLIVEPDMPSELQATAWTDDGIVMGLKHVSKPIHGVQFHPESISTECGRQIFTNFKHLTEEYHSDTRVASNSKDSDQNIHHSKNNVIMDVNDAEIIKIASTENKDKLEQKKLNYNDRQIRNVFIAKKQFPKDVNVKEIFTELYGESSASFWLDSSSAGPVQGRIDASSPLSYFGDLDSSVESYAIEYEGYNKIKKRMKNRIENYDQNIFEYLDEQLENNKKVTDFIHLYDDSLYKYEKITTNSSQLNIPFDITSAYFGFLGYETRHEATEILTRPYVSTHDTYDLSAPHSEGFKGSKWLGKLAHPSAFFMKPMQYVVYDHKEHSIFVVSTDYDITFETDEPVIRVDPISEYPGYPGSSVPSGSNDEEILRRGDRDELGAAETEALALLTRISDIVEGLEEDITISAEINSNKDMRIPVQPGVDISKMKEVNTNANEKGMGMVNGVLHAVKSKEEYKNDIYKCLDAIKAGETYEVCLTLQFKGSEKTDALKPLEVYNDLRTKNPAPYSCFIHYDPMEYYTNENNIFGTPEVETPGWYKPGGFSICSSSPERYLKATKRGYLESKPIKGTARRNLQDNKLDQKIAEELKLDEKSQAENLMVVDLVRNDFGRVCEIGSVTVPALMRIESYASVHQLVSTISGKLQKGRSLVDAIVATFPGGSMTGAPKLRTMDIIEELENRPRGIYSGAIGFIGTNGEADLNIVIRTAILAGGTVTVGSGGAIVALSDPEEEVNEVILKASAVSNALGYSLSFSEKKEHQEGEKEIIKKMEFKKITEVNSTRVPNL